MRRSIFGAVAASALSLGLSAINPAFAAEPSASRAQVPADCGYLIRSYDRRAEPLSLDITYPKTESEELGEGWVRVIYGVNAAGSVVNLETVDILGSKAFSDTLQDAFKQAQYQVALLGGRPVDYYGGVYEITFSFAGSGIRNRARVHYYGFSKAYDNAKARRNEKKFDESIAIVREAMSQPLNMYELATLSHGLTYSYLGLNDKRRALFAIRHATIDQDSFLASEARPHARALLTQLEAENNNQRAALCAFAWLKQKYPSFPLDTRLQELMATAWAQISGKGEVRTDIELVDSERPYVPNRWTHMLIRRAFKFDAAPASGAARFRLVCASFIREDSVVVGRQWNVDPVEGDCTLYFYGDNGAKFTLVEY